MLHDDWSFNMDPIDRRMQSFVKWFGEVPVEAKRMHDFEAREHSGELRLP